MTVQPVDYIPDPHALRVLWCAGASFVVWLVDTLVKSWLEDRREAKAARRRADWIWRATVLPRLQEHHDEDPARDDKGE